MKMHYHVVRLPPARVAECKLPPEVNSLDDFPPYVTTMIRDSHERAGYPGPIRLVSAGWLTDDPEIYEVKTVVGG